MLLQRATWDPKNESVNNNNNNNSNKSSSLQQQHEFQQQQELLPLVVVEQLDDINITNNNYATTSISTCKACADELAEYKIKVEQLERHLQELRQQLQQQQQQVKNTTTDNAHNNNCICNSNNDTSFNNTSTTTSTLAGMLPQLQQKHQKQQHPVCRYLTPRRSDDENINNATLLPTTAAAMAIWSSQLGRIHAASQLLRYDPNFRFFDFSPRLPRAINTIPRSWESLQHVLDIGYRRYQYILELMQQQKQQPKASHDSTNAPRKIQVLIMGGSVVAGTNCKNSVFDIVKDMYFRDIHCAWPFRLEQFINLFLIKAILGPNDDSTTIPRNMDLDLIQVTRAVMGGTNTQTGKVILEYELLPDHARHPDIVINAYSTNDMHILTVLDAAKGNVSLRDKVFEMNEDFVRYVLQNMQVQSSSNDCKNDTTAPLENDQDSKENNNLYASASRNSDHDIPPLLLHMDDYLGNEQRQIRSTTELSQSIHVLANYYGFTSMSYANLVRDLVYADTHESWFSPGGWWRAGHTTRDMQREIHPGMGMHMTSAWVTAYTIVAFSNDIL